MPWPKNWLKQQADALLGSDSTADLRCYCAAYDNLLWAVVTCDRAELGELVVRLYDDPYINLPPPIQVAAFRLWGLEPPVDPERARVATAGIALYCSPGEEAGACGGLRRIAEPDSKQA